MDNIPQLGTAADLELRAARVADPGLDLRTRHAVACELREMIDTIRDAEAGRVFPHMIPALLDLLRNSEVAFHKDAAEYQFRRVILEILHRLTTSEGTRPQASVLFAGMLYLLRHDNEENGVTCCKTIIDIIRTFRILPEEFVAEFMGILQDVFHNIKGLVVELLSESSKAADPSVVLPSIRSFRVLAEMGMVIVTFSQSQRQSVTPHIQGTLPLNFEVLALEAPAQKRAREDVEAMGGFWAGMSPTIQNAQAYTDFITAQIKMVSYLAYILRGSGEQYESYGDTLLLASLRLLQDIPANAIAARRDFMIVFRHLLGTPYRRALLPQIDKLFDEKVLLGTGAGSRESLRATAFAAVADLVHHLRNDLSARQLSHIINVYSRLIHNPCLPNSVHTLSGKMMFNLVETVLAKDTPAGATMVLTTLLETCVDKLESVTGVLQEVTDRLERSKAGEPESSKIYAIEKARPVAAAIYAVEKAEDVLAETRLLFRTFIHGFRACLSGLKKIDAPSPDGSLILRLFHGCISCMSLYDADIRDATEAMDWLAGALVEVNLHVFQEVWNQKIGFFFLTSQTRPALLHICQTLFSREATSPTLVAIVLRHLVDNLPQLGEYDDSTAVVTIRLFKLAFGAVAMHPAMNEPILASHLSKLIMDCFPLAARATRPTNYYHLLRGLFRAIGGGGGRFELLYKEVLPLLPEMLENLNRQLFISEGYSRDMIVELCLTVPLRLTHLLPHLSYLMKPLALALRGSPELVSQGLRTLELCIDNLTPDFLDPTLNTVLRELMEALQSHLRPLPINHHHAHTTLRILGKLGGRNRRLLDKEPELQFHHPSDPAKVLISFAANYESMELGSMSELAAKVLKKAATPYRIHAYTYLENCATVLFNDGLRGRDREDVFVRSLEGIFDSVHLPETHEQADAFIRQLSRQVFAAEIRRGMSQEPATRRYPSLMFASFLDALVHGLSRESQNEAILATELVESLIQDLISRGTTGEASTGDIVPLLHQIASRFSALCLDEPWVRKKAGCRGIKLILDIPNFGVKWINDREVDLVRTLLHVLKDMPHDLPRDVEDILGILIRVLRLSNNDLPTSGDAALLARNKVSHLMGIFFAELSSPNAIVRRAADTCIELLSTLTGKPIVELLLPHRDRMLTGIYTKPLRALPFPLQIGMIEAMRYCLCLEPPLPELNDELLRLLHEALALADADDLALLGRGNVRQGSLDITKLRVASIRLLTASMPITDFFSKQPATRQRVTSVYFKSLYSPSPEVKEVAHEGLRMVLTHQSRLPKELLQTGLRPILMNLADPKRLSVPGLEGLARLLKLLTNYFKVEIGYKLLDHFRYVADPQMLQASSKLPLSDNEGITKLVRLANIFHLLPAAANVFLENLVNAIVQTEAQMHFSGESPFSVPLAKYLDRYPVESMVFFRSHMHLPRHVRTLRSIIQAKLAPNLQRELASMTPTIITECLKGSNPSLLLPGLLLFSDLAEVDANWMPNYPPVIDALLHVWRSETPPSEDDATAISNAVKRHSLVVLLFQKALRAEPRVDLLFEIITVYSRHLPMDLVHLTRFLYEQVAFSSDIFYQRNVLFRFMTWFSDPSISWSHKTHFIRIVVTPTLLGRAKSAWKDALLDEELILQMHKRIWQPMIDGRMFVEADDMFNIELLHLTTVIVQYYPHLLEVARKDIIKCAWHYITSDDAVVKQVAYLLAARFFDTFETPQKFILRAWTGLLRPPHHEGRALVKQALDILAPALPRSTTQEAGYPQWAKTTRRLLAEESSGQSQLITVYQLIVRQSMLFYPVRALFIPHMVNSLSKLGLHGSASGESRLLSIDIMQTIFDWEQKASEETGSHESDSASAPPAWVTPLPFRESVVSYLVRLATAPHDAQARSILVPRALNLLRAIIGPNGWNDVTVKLNYFSRFLEQAEMNSEAALAQALSTAKVLQVVAADKPDAWFADTENAATLQRLVRKGMITDEAGLHDALHPVFDRLLNLFPLPKEDEEQQGPMSDFHNFVYSAVGDGLRNTTALRGTFLMLKSVVQVNPERMESFSLPLTKLLTKLAREHLAVQPSATGYDASVRLLTAVLEICRISAAHLGEHRKVLWMAMAQLIDKSKSASLCRCMLDIARDWALHKREPYPTMKEKAALLQKMTAFESRGDVLFNSYLELIYEIYTEPSLRRSDLTTKLEQSFLLGCRARDAGIRERFIDLLDVSVPRNLIARLSYILGVQNWEALSDTYWIYLALHLILGAVDADMGLITERKSALSTLSPSALPQRRVSDLVRPMQRLLFLDPHVAHDIWLSVFPAAWSSLNRREQNDITHHMISLLSKDYHVRQAEMRPNIIQTILTGTIACSPMVTLPPHLVKYLGKTFGAWHAGFEILQNMNRSLEDEPTFRDTVSDSLAELYAELAEDDLFYGLWRRRCLHPDTNMGLSFEQNGMWEQAATMYENAQSKTRAGSLAFSEQEYCLWEDHWILSAEKLQHWDTLYDFARNENNQELMLESAWRVKNWAENCDTLEEQINALPEVATPRRRVFEAFIALLKNPPAVEKNAEFTKILEEAMQLALRKWVALPPHLSPAHVPLLQHFQQFVELQEAVQIFGSLSATTAQNLEKKSSDLKMVLQAWRERLPNRSDDISIWSDLVAWRQNVFNAINKVYVPLISGPNQTQAAASNTNTYGFRGYHETAWIINRFAHVARKHDLLDVCFTLLNKIYTLPNIEISEAFLKLREQARCHYQKPNDLQAGLEVINNTNLLYFSTSQKAEFYTLKGMFHARFSRKDDASQAFGQAVQLDMTQAKSWAEWGKFTDRMFKEVPNDMNHAGSAVSCYLQAAGLYKSGKSRPLLTRVLWLLSVDDASFTISRAFDTYKGEAAFWYWITLIPQLCLSLSQREVKQARYILLNLAKLYPQALFFHLRTTREDMAIIKKQAAQAAIIRANANRNQTSSPATSDPTKHPEAPGVVKSDGDVIMGEVPKPSSANGASQADGTPQPVRQSWEYVEEVVQILKTAFPLLILSMETMVDQINQRFKATPEEEIYRLICMLLQDAMQQYALRVNSLEDDGQLSPPTVSNLSRMATNLSGVARKEYEEDFVKSKPSHNDYIRRLQQWRDRYERYLDSRPRIQPLDLLSHYLTEFQYGKFDDIEIPGQYTEEKDSNQNFAKIVKFGPKFENCRSHGYCWRRFTVHGSDNSRVSFAVQLPSGRHTRREERVMQVFRTFNGVLSRQKECRKRNLTFHIPAAISCSPSLRLLQNDSSYVTFGDIFEQFCEASGIAREDPVLIPGEKVKLVLREFKTTKGRMPNKTEYFTLKKDILDDIMTHMVPDSVLSQYMSRTMEGPSNLWRMRKQFALQIASTSFMTYIFCLTSRLPTRFHLSRSSGLIAMSELLPGVASHAPIFASNDVVPFRFTPNLQHFLGPIHTEGIMTSGMMAMGRGLTEPQFDLEQQLCLFSRDEVMTWMHGKGKPWTFDLTFRQNVAANIDGVVKRAETVACKIEREQALANPSSPSPANVPVVQTVINLIASATDPINLMKMTEIYAPWF
ncbi:FAT-domain-containing protein [Auriscalpium vulgare]|uniref:FAT-domain-containing protein n=1 Tax=Auriscalpium vulgare TaxID=40419 RepID=A0ACB8SAC5_9AGAM|nr:FAT-domain-containing protein [Auriscalpium vulgare]